MQMEIEGQEVVYKDLPDLQGKLTGLLDKITQERVLHDQEAKRLRHQEKKLRAFLGNSGTMPVATTDRDSDPADVAGKGGAHE